MFLKFYGLREQPFGVTPDPRYLYPSPTHREALASLVYSIESGLGFSALIAKPGMGKTTLLFHLMEQVRKTAVTAFLFQTQCNSQQLLSYLLTDMGIDVQNRDVAAMHAQLNETLVRLKRNNMRFVMIVDEAQNLDDSVLETVRLLSDFETAQSKLIQIILSGQPQLADKLSSPGLVQLRQRIAMVCRLNPLTREESEAYIDHRLRLAGYEGGSLFNQEARNLMLEHSEGIPRRINILCFNALSLGCALGRKKVDAEIVKEVIADLTLETLRPEPSAPRSPVQVSTQPLRVTLPPVMPQSGHAEGLPEAPRAEYRPMPSFSAMAAAKGGEAPHGVRVALLASIFLALSFLYFSFSVKMPSPAQLERWLPLPQRVAAMPLAHPQPADKTAPGAPAVVPVVPSAPAAGAAGQTADLAASTVTVSVKQGEWLYHICTREFGSCDAQLLEEIRGLNPELTDPNIIAIGQSIRLPKVPDAARNGITSTDGTQISKVVRSR